MIPRCAFITAKSFKMILVLSQAPIAARKAMTRITVTQILITIKILTSQQFYHNLTGIRDKKMIEFLWEVISMTEVLFWIIYYLLLMTIFVRAIYSVIKKKLSPLAMIAILVIVSVPMVSLMNSIGRPLEMNEFEFLAREFKQGALWAIFTIVGYLYLLVWFILSLKK